MKFIEDAVNVLDKKWLMSKEKINMWDYDKLFAEGSVVGLKNISLNKIFNHGVTCKKYWDDDNEIDWSHYQNEDLRYCIFSIQYIVHLDEHGNVVEKLFDRDRDMNAMPELKHGMFVKVKIGNEESFGYVDTYKQRIIYQDGSFDNLENIDTWMDEDLIAIYKDADCFEGCNQSTLIWEKQ